MRQQRRTDTLTAAAHFAQAGFHLLMKEYTLPKRRLRLTEAGSAEDRQVHRSGGDRELAVVRGEGQIRDLLAGEDGAREVHSVQRTERRRERLGRTLQHRPIQRDELERLQPIEECRPPLRNIVVREMQLEARAVDRS